MYAKMKEFGPMGGGVHPARPLDPPMHLVTYAPFVTVTVKREYNSESKSEANQAFKLKAIYFMPLGYSVELQTLSSTSLTIG